MSKWKRRILVAVVVTLVAYPVAWIVVKRSDAYAVSEQFLRANPVVADYLGPIKSIELEPWGYSIRFSGAYGNAHFEFEVEGANASGKAYVELEKRGIWEVRFARLVEPGQKVVQLAGK